MHSSISTPLEKPTVILHLLLAAVLCVGCNEKLRNLVDPPEDLYVPLAVQPIDLKTAESSVRVNVENRYPGEHVIAISAPHPPAIGQDILLDATFRVQARGEGILLIDEKVAGPFHGHFWSSDGSGGQRIFTYDVPSDLPQDTPIDLTVTVLQPDHRFSDRYGAPELLVQKASDE